MNRLNTHTGWARALASLIEQSAIVRDLGPLAALVFGSLALALIFNVLFIRPSSPSSLEEPAPAVQETDMHTAYEMAKSGEALLIDTESPATFAKEHIAGAINLPLRELETYYPRFAAEVPRDRFLILYCTPGCLSKEMVARKLLKRGYQKVRIMRTGVEEWEQAGGPVARGVPGEQTGQE